MKALRRYLLTEGQRNEFADGAIPIEYKYVFLSRWIGTMTPREIAEDAEWFEAIDVCSAAYQQAEAGPQVTNRG